MSYFVSPLLCPNYEDDFPIFPSRHYLKNWPDMWPEEKYAEGALYRQWKQQQATRYVLTPRDKRENAIRYMKTHKPKDLHLHEIKQLGVVYEMARDAGFEEFEATGLWPGQTIDHKLYRIR